jgi:hypothetical protein
MQIYNAQIGRLCGGVAGDPANALFTIRAVVDFSDHTRAAQRLLK